jgi:hypothetical protein
LWGMERCGFIEDALLMDVTGEVCVVETYTVKCFIFSLEICGGMNVWKFMNVPKWLFGSLSLLTFD